MSDAKSKLSKVQKPYAGLGERMQRARKSVTVHGRLLPAQEVGDSLTPKRARLTISRWETGVVKPPPLELDGYLKVLMQRGLPEKEAEAIWEFAYTGTHFMARRDSPQTPLPDERFILKSDYPLYFEDQLQKTKKISMLGTNLRRVLKWRPHIERIIDGGGSVEAVLVDPLSDATRYSAYQEHGDSTTLSLATFVGHVDNCWQWLSKQQTKNNYRFYDQVNIKKIDYPLAFGLDVLEFEDGDGVIYIRFYPLMYGENEHDRPIIEFTRESEESRDWYDVFKTQWERHSSKAESWNVPRK
jgi:hypothetical protein